MAHKECAVFGGIVFEVHAGARTGPMPQVGLIAEQSRKQADAPAPVMALDSPRCMVRILFLRLHNIGKVGRVCYTLPSPSFLLWFN
jgi:hypothetical protein